VDYESELLGQPLAARENRGHDEDLRRLREAVAAADENLVGRPGEDEAFAAFLERSERFLDRLSAAYRFERRPLL